MRKRLLIFSRYFWPAYQSGGPVRSLIGLCDHFKDSYDIHIVCYNHDKNDKTPYDAVPTHEWVKTAHANVYYTAHHAAKPSHFKRLINDVQPDLIYLQSLYDAHFTQKILLLRLLNQFRNTPILLAPRGELFEGAIGTSPLKKRLYIKLFRYLFARKWLHFQASTHDESEACRRFFPNSKNQVYIAQDIQSFLAPECAPLPKEPGHLALIYLARLAENKNLLYAIERLRDLQGNVALHIYGPEENADYVLQCKQAAASLPSNITITFHGALPHEKVAQTLQQHHAYILPTKGENYGHGIVEAMACGLPVLISDQTCFNPAQHDAGQAISLTDTANWQTTLNTYVQMDAAPYQTQSQNARTYAKQALDQTKQVAAHHKMFETILG